MSEEASVHFDEERGIIVFPESVVVVAFDESNCIALVRQSRRVVNAETLELPGGKVEPGETIAEAAQRELLEEAGLLCDRFHHWTSLDMDFSVSRHVTHIVVGRISTRDGVGLYETSFCSSEELIERIQSRAITHAPTVAAALALSLGLLPP